jgi:hypothetical protein
LKFDSTASSDKSTTAQWFLTLINVTCKNWKDWGFKYDPVSPASGQQVFIDRLRLYSNDHNAGGSQYNSVQGYAKSLYDSRIGTIWASSFTFYTGCDQTSVSAAYIGGGGQYPLQVYSDMMTFERIVTDNAQRNGLYIGNGANYNRFNSTLVSNPNINSTYSAIYNAGGDYNVINATIAQDVGRTWDVGVAEASGCQWNIYDITYGPSVIDDYEFSLQRDSYAKVTFSGVSYARILENGSGDYTWTFPERESEKVCGAKSYPDSSADSVMCIAGHYAPDTTTPATNYELDEIAGSYMTFWHAVCHTHVAPGSGKSYTWTLEVEHSPTSLTFSVADTNTEVSVHDQYCNATQFDTLRWLIEPSGTPTGGYYQVTVRYVRDIQLYS